MAEVITPAAAGRGQGPGLSFQIGNKILGQPLMMHGDVAARLYAAIKAKDFDGDLSVSIGGADVSRFVGTRGRNGYNVTEDGIAIVQVSGLLLDRGAWLDGGGWITTYEGLAEQFCRLMKDEAVKQVILDVDSGGGMAAGCFDLCSGPLADLKRKKHVTAIAQNAAYSGAYAIACTAHEMYVTRLGGAGSIGVIMTHQSYESFLEKAGIAPTIIYAGSHKADGNPYQALSHGARAEMTASIDQIHDVFVRHVAKHRSLDEDTVRGFEARCYQGEKAVSAKLADGVLTFDALLTKLRKGSSGTRGSPSPARKGRTMPNDQPAAAGSEYEGMIAAAITAALNANKPAATAPTPAPAVTTTPAPAAVAPADAATLERQRIAGIVGSDAGKARPSLANHLAFATSMSVADATAILAASAVEQPGAASPAGAPANPQQAAVGDALRALMQTGQHTAGIKPEAAAPANGQPAATSAAPSNMPSLAEKLAAQFQPPKIGRRK